MTKKIAVCKTTTAPGRQRIVTVGKYSIGVFNVEGSYFAVLNVCPHRSGPLCEGPAVRDLPADGPVRIQLRPKRWPGAMRGTAGSSTFAPASVWAPPQ